MLLLIKLLLIKRRLWLHLLLFCEGIGTLIENEEGRKEEDKKRKEARTRTTRTRTTTKTRIIKQEHQDGPYQQVGGQGCWFQK